MCHLLLSVEDVFQPLVIGYCGAGYRVWDPKTNVITETRDMRFDESNYKYNKEEKRNPYINYYTDDEQEYLELNQPLEMEKSTTRNKEDNMSHESQKSDDESSEEYEDSEYLEIKKNNQRKRITKLPNRYKEYDMSSIAYTLMSEEPTSYNDAIKEKEWLKAINSELKAHKTWEEYNLPEGQKAIDTRWVFRKKPDGTKKARLVAKGCKKTPLKMFTHL